MKKYIGLSISTFLFFYNIVLQAQPIGKWTWANQIGGSVSNASEQPTGLSLTNNGKLYVVGNFTAPVVNFNNGITATNTNNNLTTDGFLAQYDTNGTCNWARNIGGVGQDFTADVVADNNNNAIVTGYFSGTMNLDTTTLTTAPSTTNTYIVKYNSSGAVMWAVNIAGATNLPKKIITDAAGNIYVTGIFFGTITVGTTNLTPLNVDAYVAKYSPSGVPIWAERIGGVASDESRDIAVDNFGNVYVTGSFKQSMTVGATTITATGTSKSDIFVAKYRASNGSPVWIKRAGHNTNSNNSEEGRGITTNAQGEVFLAASIEAGNNGNNTDFGNGVKTVMPSSGNGAGTVVVKYDSLGNAQWVARPTIPSLSSQEVTLNHIRVDALGNIYAGGSFKGTPTFGSTTLTGGGKKDVLVVKLLPNGAWNLAVRAGTSAADDVNSAMDVDADGNIYATGVFAGNSSSPIRFNSGTADEISFSTSGNNDGYIGKLIQTCAVQPTPTITANGATTFCQGDSVILESSGATGVSFLWSNGATTKSITVKQGGKYTVRTSNEGCISPTSDTTQVTVNPIPTTPTITASGATTFCDGDSVTLISSLGDAYLWSDGSTASSITVSASGNFTVRTISAQGCTSAVSPATVVTVNALPTTPTITASGATTFCDGDSVTLTSSLGDAYLWSDGSTASSITVSASGSFTVRTISAQGCTSAVSPATVVTVNALPTTPTITASGATTFCDGDNVTLTSSLGDAYFLWSNGSTASSITVSASDNFTVRTISAQGCTSAVSPATTVTVNPIPATPSITASGATTFCDGDSVTLTSSLGDTYLWSNGSTASSITVSASGNFTVRTISAQGCTSAVSPATTVTVYQNPSVSIDVPDDIWYKDETYTLTASATLPVSYSWTTAPFSQGSTTNSSLEVVPTTVGENFEYVVVVTTNFGCQATASVFKNVILKALRIPTGFSPNGDGVNDTWEIDGIDQYPNAVIQVYNRWGNVVFESTGSSYYRNYWSGDDLAQGTYYFVIDLQDGNKQKGTLTIVR